MLFNNHIKAYEVRAFIKYTKYRVGDKYFLWLKNSYRCTTRLPWMGNINNRHKWNNLTESILLKMQWIKF